MTDPGTDGGEYEVRPVRSTDVEGVASLRSLVMGGDAGDEAAEFRWKVQDAPFASRGRAVVAELDGEIVGLNSTVALPFRVDGRTLMAAQFVDATVHPDHRRRGILASMAFDLFGDASDWAELFWALPMPTATTILEDGASIADIVADAGVDMSIGPFPERYRVQRPSALRPRGPTWAVRAMEAVARPAIGAYRRVTSGTSPRADGTTVERHDGVPVEELAALHRRTAPDAPHLVRDEELYAWRFSHPLWDYVTYTASRDGRTVAAVVLGSMSFGPDLVMTRLTEVLPLGVSDVGEAVVADLLSTALADHRESAVVVAGGTSLPRSLLDAFGFRPPDSRLLSTALNSPIFYRSSLAYLPIRTAEGVARPLDDWLLTYYGPEIG